MQGKVKQWWNSVPSKGGVIGAIIGALASAKSHNPVDRPIKNAGKTAVYTGLGYLIGQWVEKVLKKK